jgi:hypothetical protein
MGASATFIVMGLIATSAPDYRAPLTEEEYAQATAEGKYLCEITKGYFIIVKDVFRYESCTHITPDTEGEDAARIRERMELSAFNEESDKKYDEIFKKYRK